MNLYICGQRINDEGKTSTQSPLAEFYRSNQNMALPYLPPESHCMNVRKERVGNDIQGKEKKIHNILTSNLVNKHIDKLFLKEARFPLLTKKNHI